MIFWPPPRYLTKPCVSGDGGLEHIWIDARPVTVTCVTHLCLEYCVTRTCLVYMCDTLTSRLHVWHTNISHNVSRSLTVRHTFYLHVWHLRLEYGGTHICLVYICDTHTSRLHVWHTNVSYDVRHTYVSFICVTHTRHNYIWEDPRENGKKMHFCDG